MNDSLEALIAIAKTPAQTWAYNQYEIARDAIRRRLWPEALQALDRASNGFGDHPGYALEFRFHHSKGMIYLGNFRNADPDVVDLAKAEEAFLAAARYAKADYPSEAGRSFLAAGWAAYCQGKMDAALQHTTNAATLHPQLAEAFFQLGKIKMHIGNPEPALLDLRKAIESDRLYAIKATADGDFCRFEPRLAQFLDDLRRHAQRQADEACERAAAAVREMRAWRAEGCPDGRHAVEHHLEAERSRAQGTFFGCQDAIPSAREAHQFSLKAVELARSRLVREIGWLHAEMQRIVDDPRVREHAPERRRAAEHALCEVRQNRSVGESTALLGDVERFHAAKRTAEGAEHSALARIAALEAVTAHNVQVRNQKRPLVVGTILGLVLLLASAWAIDTAARAVHVPTSPPDLKKALRDLKSGAINDAQFNTIYAAATRRDEYHWPSGAWVIPASIAVVVPVVFAGVMRRRQYEPMPPKS